MKRIVYLAIVLFPISVFAQQPTPPMPPQQGPVLVPQMDKNGDKKVSREEFLRTAEERALKQFGNLDKNSDGFITEKEETEARNQAMEMMRKQMEAARARAPKQPPAR